MANISDLTRKEQVLAYLTERLGQWVDGPELATERVGGSEGLRRVRELKEEGHDIRMRMHPDPQRDIWQYRIIPRVDHEPGPSVTHVTQEQNRALSQPVQTVLPSEPPVYPKPELPRGPRPGIGEAVKRKEDGTFEYVPPQQAILEEQLTTPPDPPQPAGRSFDSLPKGFSYGEVAVCPRCKSKTTRGRIVKRKEKHGQGRADREDEMGSKLVDIDGILLFRDPYAKKPEPCHRCNGYGIVPNEGPIPLTMPSG